MKTKTFSILFALVMVLSMSVGVFAQDFSETWDENTVLTFFNDVDLVFPDLFMDEDSNFLWTDSVRPLPSTFVDKAVTEDDLVDKAAILGPTAKAMKAEYDPCGDGLIKFDVTILRADPATTAAAGYYMGEEFVTYIRDIKATVNDGTNTYKLGVKKCQSTGGDDCKSVIFRRVGTNYEAHLKGYLTAPIVMNNTGSYTVNMEIDYSTYMTMLWPVDNTQGGGLDTGFVTATATATPTRKNYCQTNLQAYDGLRWGDSVRAKYDENTGEARIQAMIRNYQPSLTELKRTNYVIPAEIAFRNPADPDDVIRVTKYTCTYKIYNVANAAPMSNFCKFGEGIAIPDHGMLYLDITIPHIPGSVLRDASGDPIEFQMRVGGLTYMLGNLLPNPGNPKWMYATDYPCPPVSRMQVMDPLKPFMTFFKLIDDDPIEPSGPYGVYEGGLWGMYQKCGKSAYLAVRLKNDGVMDEIVDLNHVAVAINGGTPMKFGWVLSTMIPEKGNKIVLEGGDEVILFGRAKVTDIPSQLNSDLAMTGAVNFTDFGFYITGKIFSDHNNVNCVVAP